MIAALDLRPPVVLARLDQVQFIVAGGAVLGGLKLTGLRMPGETLRIAVARRVHRRAGEGVVGGDRAIWVEAQVLAAQ